MTTLGTGLERSRGAGSIAPGLLEDADLVLAAAMVCGDRFSAICPSFRAEDLDVLDRRRAILFRIALAEWQGGRAVTPSSVERIARLRHGLRDEVGPLLVECYESYRLLVPYQVEVGHATTAAQRIMAYAAVYQLKQAAECLDPAALSCKPDEAAGALADLARTAEEGSNRLLGGGAPRKRDAVHDIADAILRLVEGRLPSIMPDDSARAPRANGHKDLGDDLVQRSGE